MTYPETILTIKLWEWEGVKETWEMQMNKSPDGETQKWIDNAEDHINELRLAIIKIKQP